MLISCATKTFSAQKDKFLWEANNATNHLQLQLVLLTAAVKLQHVKIGCEKEKKMEQTFEVSALSFRT